MKDKLIRAMTDAGAFRVLAVDATEAAQAGQDAHGLGAAETIALSRLLSGCLLIRSTIHPNDRLQVTMNHNGSVGDLSVDAWPNGMVRGRILNGAKKKPGKPPIGDVGVVEVSRSRAGMSGVHQSATLMITGTIQDEFQLYLLESEQIASAIVLHSELRESGEVAWAGGALVQLLPEAEPDDLKKIVPRLEELLANLKKTSDGLTPEDLVKRALPEDLPYTLVAEEEFQFRCNCDETRVLSALATLPKQEVEDILERKEVLELACGYCSRTYNVHPEKLRSLLETN